MILFMQQSYSQLVAIKFLVFIDEKGETTLTPYEVSALETLKMKPKADTSISEDFIN